MDCIESNKKIDSWLKENLSEKRYLHSVGCAECAAQLAKQFGQDEEKACIAGLLHDCAKCFDRETMLALAEKIPKSFGLDASEVSNFKVLHAPVSAYIAKKEFGIVDEEILSAIRWHTLGKVNMSDFEKVVFLADKIEQGTRDLSYREKIMKILEDEDGLNQALLVCYKETIKSLVKRDLKICQTTIDIYNSMLV